MYLQEEVNINTLPVRTQPNANRLGLTNSYRNELMTIRASFFVVELHPFGSVLRIIVDINLLVA